jgi:hypothetical protein
LETTPPWARQRVKRELPRTKAQNLPRLSVSRHRPTRGHQRQRKKKRRKKRAKRNFKMTFSTIARMMRVLATGQVLAERREDLARIRSSE